MTIGYSDSERVDRIAKELITWTLYQVTVDKYHVEFWFEPWDCLLNAAFRFELRSADGRSDYVYDVQAEGGRKRLDVDRMLRRKITAVSALNERQLGLTFESGDILVIHDSPKTRSAWFYRYNGTDHNAPLVWSAEDDEGEEDF